MQQKKEKNRLTGSQISPGRKRVSANCCEMKKEKKNMGERAQEELRSVSGGRQSDFSAQRNPSWPFENVRRTSQ